MIQRVIASYRAARSSSSVTHQALAIWTRCETAMIGALGIAALFVFLYGMFARYILPVLAPDWAEELSIYLMIWALLLSGGPLIGESRHVTAEVFTHLLPASVCHKLNLISLCLMALFCAILSWLGWELTQLAIAIGERSESSLAMPQGYYYVALMVAMALMSLRAIVMLVVAVMESPRLPADAGKGGSAS